MYSFRGGRVENILRLAAERPTYRLPTNYRSACSIIATANRLMSEPGRKRMESFRRELGQVTLGTYESHIAEATSIAEYIRLSGRPASDFAILTRYNARADVVRDALAAQGVKLRTMAKPALDGRAMDMLHDLARQPAFESPIGEVLASLGMDMKDIRIVGEQWRGSLSETILALTMAEEEATGDGVHVGTVHSLKGGERPVVFVAGMEAHTWPGKKTGEELAEERRIAYVAFTRAQDELHVSWARNAPDSGGFGNVKAAPSPFTDCIPQA